MNPVSMGFVSISPAPGSATWTAYMDSSGNFFLGDSTSNTAGYMSWNQSNAALAVQGTLNARAGNFTSTVTIGKGSTAGTLTVGTNGSNTITIAGTNSASTTKVAASNGAFELLADGNASFADGNITFAADGDITSRTFLIERTRLFGSGSDGDILHYANAVTAPSLTSNTGFSQGPWSNSRGQVVLTRTSAGNWRMDNDIYAQNYNFPSGYTSTLDTNGYRLFVMDTLTTQSTTTIHNDGAGGSAGGDTANTAGTGGAGGAAGGGGNLSSGQAGSPGGAGGNRADPDAVSGAGGGGGGGTGGFVFIAARNISNSGTIRSHGGVGGAGGSSSE